MYRMMSVIATFLYRRIHSCNFHLAMARRVKANLVRLNPGKSEEQILDEYYIRKITLCLMVLVVGVMLGILASLNAKNSLLMEENGLLYRGEYPEESKEIQVMAKREGVEVTLPIEVKTRRLTDSEAEEMLDLLEENLSTLILGGNTDLQNVREDLNLLDEYEGFPATVDWKTNSPDMLSSEGKLKEIKNTSQIRLTATLNYGEIERRCELDVVVHPPVLSAEEQLRRELQEMLDIGNEETSTQTEWQLPIEWNGHEIYWQQVIGDNGLLICFASLGVSVLLYFCSDRDLEDKIRKRRDTLRREYPEIVHKLVLFAEAGMTVRGSFQKMADDYEEIAFSCNELNAGRSETGVYERMGKRIALQEYIRLGTLLSQNLRRGNKALLARLREEADRASEEHLHRARKAGEEAGTKLLVPMVLQLAVVMVMIMVPVFLDM